jgi:lipopolysaccharide/colanic/teichoic acid biosynthesis glycosyltransferase
MVKRALDIALAGAGLMASSPLWLVVAVIVKLQDGGPVFFRQARIGLHGRHFRVLKFRSMVPDAEARSGALQAVKGDPRVTPFGRFLRGTALDELPQLWNILRGDMSFVGPRALMPGEIEAGGTGELVPIENVPGFEGRCAVRPGLTGLAQVYAPRTLPRQRKFRYDRIYIRKQSLCLDAWLILQSFWISLRGRWEEPGA